MAFAVLDHVERILYRQALGKVLVVRQNATAVAGREDVGDHLQMVLTEDRLYFFEARHVIGRLEVDRVEAGGEQDAVEAVLRRRSGYPADVIEILVRAEPARDVDPAVREHFLGGPGDARQEQEGKTIFAHLGTIISGVLNRFREFVYLLDADHWL